MEYRKNRSLWLKVAGVSVAYSVLVSFAGLYWHQNVFPVMLGEGGGAAWAALMALSSISIWGVLPAVAALLLLGRLYGKNFFVEFWRHRKDPGEIGARVFTMLVSAASSSLSIWLVAGSLWGPKSQYSAFHIVLSIMILAAMLNEGIVRAERAAAERRANHIEAEQIDT